MENNARPPAFIMAEHNNVSRCGLSDMVRRQLKKKYLWVGNITCYNTLIAALQKHPNAIVLLCVSLVNFDLTFQLYDLNQKFPHAKIILSSDDYNLIYAELVRQGNAAGYVVKCNLKASQMLKAVNMVTTGKPFLPVESEEIIPGTKQLINLKDQRYSTIFYHMLENKSQTEIIDLTGIKKTTVNRLHLEITTIALQHSKYGVWGYALLNHLLTPEMAKQVNN